MPIVSPVTTGDVTWDELRRDDPELASWCADRWLGAWQPLPNLGNEQAGRRGTFGASAGDDVDLDPYLYVTHWGDVAEDEYWNDEHFPGASRTVATLAAAPDQRASALMFLRRGRDQLRGP